MKQEMILKQKLPEGWKWSTLGKECDVVTGGTPQRHIKEYYGGKTPWIKPSDLDKEVFVYSSDEYLTEEGCKKSRLLPAGSVLVTCIGNLGKLAIAKCELATNQQINSLIPHDNINSKYLYYYMGFIQPLIVIKASTALIPIINKTIFSNIPFLVPPLPVQKQIVAKLDAQMTQIEIMKKEAEKEKEASEEYYESFTNNLITNYKYGVVSKISDVCKEDKKQIIATSDEAKKRTYIGMEDVSSNTGIITINHENQREKILSNTFKFDNRHVLYGKLRPYLNKVAIPDFEGRCSTELIPILPKDNCKREFLALLMRTQKVIHAAMKNKTGSRMPRADMSEVMKVEFKLPPLDEQEKINKEFLEFSGNYTCLKNIEINRNNAISILPSSILNEIFGKYELP